MDLQMLQIIWFVLVTVLFIGFFFLEGFDYGVGIVLPFMGKNDTERRMIINSIGPVWDGNEVWMLTAGGATFAAFPSVYATMFGMMYFALFLMLLGLIIRGVAFEYRSKVNSATWRNTWDWMIFIGSLLPAFLWGVAVANLMQGFAIGQDMLYKGTFFDLLTPFTICGGIAFVLIFAFHGSAFLTLKLGDTNMIERIRKNALKLGVLAAVFYVVCLGFVFYTTDMFNSILSLALMLLTAAVFLYSIYSICLKKLYMQGFISSSLAIIFFTISVFAGLFPRLLISTLNPDWSLTITNSSSTEYTLTIMTIAAACFVPVVLVYQAWTYWVFRKRVTDKQHLEY